MKGAEDHYAWGTFQHAVGEEPAVMALAGLEGGAIECVGGLEATARTTRTFNWYIASTDETAMAAAIARVVMAMRIWLRIVGAERSGRTAISHRHG